MQSVPTDVLGCSLDIGGYPASDEGRRWCDGHSCVECGEEVLDAINEELYALESERDAAYNKGYDTGFASADDWLGQHENAMREHGWVKLPVDADGVPIHIGDELEDVDNPSSHGEVHRIELTPDACWVFVNGFGRTSNHYRHHHEPTVEDVLRGVVTLCHNTWKEKSPFHFYGVDDVMKSGNIADFASKLRLAGDAE